MKIHSCGKIAAFFVNPVERPSRVTRHFRQCFAILMRSYTFAHYDTFSDYLAVGVSFCQISNTFFTYYEYVAMKLACVQRMKYRYY